MKVSLDGFVFPEVAGGGWSFVPGTAPHVRTFELPIDVAISLHANGSPLSSSLILDASAEGLGTKTIQALTIISVEPTNDRNTAALSVADLRWQWRYPSFRRSYNVPKRSGDLRRTPGVALAIDPVEADLTFEPWSLRDGQTVWTGEQVLIDVLNEVAPGWTRESVSAGSDLPEVQDLELYGLSHDAALGQVLAYFGLALSVFVDPTGTVVLYDRLSGGERTLLGLDPSAGELRTRPRGSSLSGGPGHPLPQRPYPRFRDRRRERPSAVRVLFDRSLELRIDFREEAGGAETLSTSPRDANPPRVENVVRIPEDVSIGDNDYVRGSWIPLEEYVSYLATQSHPADLPPINLGLLRRGYLAPVLSQYGNPAFDPTGVWARRVRALKASYRLQYRLREPWLARIRSIRPYRVAVRDPETGGLGPAEVYSDHAEWITWRWLESRRASDTESHQIIQNRYANAAARGGSIVGTDLTDLTPAPARVVIEDEDQGIISLSFEVDWTGQASVVLPSAIAEDGAATDDPTDDIQWLEWEDLSEAHEVSIVLTVTMGAPNDLRVFHQVDVTPNQVSGIVARALGEGAEGPVLVVRVSDPYRVARFGWDDTNAEALHQAVAEGSNVDLGPILGDPINAEDIRAQAIAIAARVYHSYVDRLAGGLHIAFAPDVLPTGTALISHEAEVGRGLITRIQLPTEPPRRSDDSFLPPAVRRRLNRQIDP